MGEFLEALRDPDIPFLRYALLAGVLSSFALGILGSYVVARRITYLAAAISHSVLGGIGAALYLQRAHGLDWCDPMYGAVLAALASALVIGSASLYARQREDTVISAVWSVGMAAGLLLLYKTPGYTEPMSYLFGDINYITRADLWLIVALDAAVVLLAVAFRNKLAAVCFDEEFAELRGLRAKAYYLFLLCLVALGVVLLVRVVGIVMVIALLTLPAAAASQFARRLWQMMTLATLFCAVFIVFGLAASYRFELPTGPAIIVLAAGAYLLAVGLRRLGRRGGRAPSARR
jgi:zinc transport system permease protein